LRLRSSPAPFQLWPSVHECLPACLPLFARPQNHSCSPSMYSKILNVDGRQRLVFFARQDIEAGQELTFNYRWGGSWGGEGLALGEAERGVARGTARVGRGDGAAGSASRTASACTLACVAVAAHRLRSQPCAGLNEARARSGSRAPAAPQTALGSSISPAQVKLVGHCAHLFARRQTRDVGGPDLAPESHSLSVHFLFYRVLSSASHSLYSLQPSLPFRPHFSNSLISHSHCLFYIQQYPDHAPVRPCNSPVIDYCELGPAGGCGRDGGPHLYLARSGKHGRATAGH
jgi:hypothetical protein